MCSILYWHNRNDYATSKQTFLVVPAHVSAKKDIDKDIYNSIYIVHMIETLYQKFIPLKSQWFQIMLSLAGGEQHGYGIMQEVLERTAGKERLWPATLYGSIKRLIEA